MNVRVEIFWDENRFGSWAMKVYKDGQMIRYDRLNASQNWEIDDTNPGLNDEALIDAARQHQSWYGIEFSRNVINIIR